MLNSLSIFNNVINHRKFTDEELVLLDNSNIKVYSTSAYNIAIKVKNRYTTLLSSAVCIKSIHDVCSNINSIADASKLDGTLYERILILDTEYRNYTSNDEYKKHLNQLFIKLHHDICCSNL